MFASREDLDAAAGTEEHALFLQLLAGSMWRLEKDNAARTWVAVPDDTTITRFGFTRADFDDTPPDLPEYIRDVVVPASVGRYQLRAALLQMGLFDSVDAHLQQADALVRMTWIDAPEFSRDSELVSVISAFLELTSDQMDDVFIFASTIRG